MTRKQIKHKKFTIFALAVILASFACQRALALELTDESGSKFILESFTFYSAELDARYGIKDQVCQKGAIERNHWRCPDCNKGRGFKLESYEVADTILPTPFVILENPTKCRHLDPYFNSITITAVDYRSSAIRFRIGAASPLPQEDIACSPGTPCAPSIEEESLKNAQDFTTSCTVNQSRRFGLWIGETRLICRSADGRSEVRYLKVSD